MGANAPVGVDFMGVIGVDCAGCGLMACGFCKMRALLCLSEAKGK